jgi:hypothetical protein
MTIIDWPANLTYFAADIPVLSQGLASAGAALTGQERFVATNAGRWRYGCRVRLETRDKVIAWRALLVQCQWRANRVRVPILDWFHSPAAVAGLLEPGDTRSDIPHSDDSTHSDGAGYAAESSAALAASSAAIGAASLQITMATGQQPDPGQFFSDGDWLYLIRTSSLVSGTTYDVTFSPTLRKAIPAGASISFDRLFCLMRFESDEVMRGEQDVTLIAELSLSFTEAIL